MEYVGGTSLKSLLKQRMQATPAATTRSPSTRRSPTSSRSCRRSSTCTTSGLVYCDFKPDNVIQVGDASSSSTSAGCAGSTTTTRRSTARWATRRPRSPRSGPSVASDIYTIGRTLLVLTMEFRGYQTTYVDSLPPVDDDAAVPAVRLALPVAAQGLRHPTRTTGSARPTSCASSCSACCARSSRWTSGWRRATGSSSSRCCSRRRPSQTDGLDWQTLPGAARRPHRPAGRLAARPSDAGDPAASGSALLHSGARHRRRRSTSPPAAPRSPPGSPTVVDSAANAMLPSTRGSGGRSGCRGSPALAAGRRRARRRVAFNAVYGQVPGELAPKLALACACEASERARRSPRTSTRPAHAPTPTTSPAAAFGMARIRTERGDIDGAVQALDLVPLDSRAYALARQAAGRTARGLRRGPTGPVAGVVAASTRC